MKEWQKTKMPLGFFMKVFNDSMELGVYVYAASLVGTKEGNEVVIE